MVSDCSGARVENDTRRARYKQYIHGLGGPAVRPLAARAKGPGFYSSIAQHIQRLISRAFTYGAVGSLVFELILGRSIWAHFPPVPLDSTV